MISCILVRLDLRHVVDDVFTLSSFFICFLGHHYCYCNFFFFSFKYLHDVEFGLMNVYLDVDVMIFRPDLEYSRSYFLKLISGNQLN